MNEYFDLSASTLSTKSSENALAFAGFHTNEVPRVDGVLKIAGPPKEGGSRYLTLTFVLDLDGDADRHKALVGRFAGAGQNALEARLGPGFEYLIDVELDAFAHSKQFFIEEMNLYFRETANLERPFIEGRILPALSELLDFQFDPVDWLSEDQDNPTLQSRAARLLARLRNNHSS